MNGRQNLSKNATPLKDWLGRMSEPEQASFAKDNYFPEDVALDFKDFRQFFADRKEVLRNKLKKALALTNAKSVVTQDEWNDHDEEESETAVTRLASV